MIIFECYTGRGIVSSAYKYVAVYHSEIHPTRGGKKRGFLDLHWLYFHQKWKHSFIGKLCFPPTYSVLLLSKILFMHFDSAHLRLSETENILTFWEILFAKLFHKRNLILYILRYLLQLITVEAYWQNYLYWHKSTFMWQNICHKTFQHCPCSVFVFRQTMSQCLSLQTGMCVIFSTIQILKSFWLLYNSSA